MDISIPPFLCPFIPSYRDCQSVTYWSLIYLFIMHISILIYLNNEKDIPEIFKENNTIKSVNIYIYKCEHDTTMFSKLWSGIQALFSVGTLRPMQYFAAFVNTFNYYWEPSCFGTSMRFLLSFWNYILIERVCNILRKLCNIWFFGRALTWLRSKLTIGELCKKNFPLPTTSSLTFFLSDAFLN